MPKDRHVVLGLVTTKRPKLEDKNFLKRRLDEAAKLVDPAHWPLVRNAASQVSLKAI
jgi:hypothetical protein